MFGMSFQTQVPIIGAAYLGYFVAAAVAIGGLSGDPDSRTWLEYSFQVVFVTSGLHFGLMLLGFTQENYKPHPVWPEVLFLYSDFLMACALGATITAYVLDDSHDTNRTMAYIGNGTVMGTQVFCAYKTITLATDVKDGTRDRETGALLTPLPT
tara:strand:- start:685 stop:1146 length:462 start_codon:yes stop_codon:yes gene_type:complete